MNLASRATRPRRVARALRDVARAFPSWPRTGTARGAGSRRPAGPRRSRRSTPAKPKLATRPPAPSWRRSSRTRRRCSAARPTSSSRPRRSSTGAGVFSRGLRRAEHPVRSPRARHGCDRERPRRPRRDREAVRLDLPHLQRLHAARRAPLGAHEPAGRLGLDARLGRARRGRPDPPARRALHGAPRDPEPLGDPPGRRQRDRDRLEDRARAPGGPGRDPLTRQNVPVLDPDDVAARRAPSAATSSGTDERQRARPDPDRHRLRGGLALEAGKRLEDEGRARVVSMPCWELFEVQPVDYRDSVLPPEVEARLAVEAGVSLGWHRWVGRAGRASRSSASAPRPRAPPCSRSSASHLRTSSRAPEALLERRQPVGPGGTTWPRPTCTSSRTRGQSVWIDYLSRDLLQDGELERMMRSGRGRRRDVEPDDLPEGDLGRRRLRRAAPGGARRDRRPEGDLRRLAVQGRGRRLRPPAQGLGRGRRQDGYVSIEVDPTLAYDTEATIAEAVRFHELIDRPNLFVKIPATKPGLPAIEDMIAKGKSINVTLIFSLKRYAEVAEAYIRGLERLVAGGGDPETVASVASFFVSRVDTEADRGSTRSAVTTSSRASWRSRTPSSPTSATRISLGRALGVPRGRRAPPQRLPLGLDVDEEPRLPRRHVRRGADRPS